MRTPPTTVYFAATEKLDDEKRFYGPRQPSRLYGSLAQAKLFLSHHPRREQRLFKATVTWEEVPLDDLLVHQ
jgi:hypothetical protein